MKRYRYKENFLYEFDSDTKADFQKQASAVTIGVYDGVHYGHRQIISELVHRSKEKNLKSVVVTFDPHPRKVLVNQSSESIKVLTTLDEKLPILESLGVDIVIVVEFTKAFSEMTAELFVENFLIKEISVSQIIIGYDHGFGKDRKGTIDTLEELSSKHHFEVFVIEEQRSNEQHISSSTIRKFLLEGYLEEANQLLGSPYRLTGKVIHGDRIGITIGYPTANLDIHPDKLIPKKGVYVSDVLIDDVKYRGMMNIGVRPTVTSESKLRIELHVLDYEGDLYGKVISPRLLARIRDEQKFSGIEELKTQLGIVKQIAQLYSNTNEIVAKTT